MAMGGNGSLKVEDANAFAVERIFERLTRAIRDGDSQGRDHWISWMVSAWLTYRFMERFVERLAAALERQGEDVDPAVLRKALQEAATEGTGVE